MPRERSGLPLKMMDLQQRRASYELLQAGLSHQGYLKVATIMSLESVLRELEKDRPGNNDRRDPEKYWFSIFGTPSETEPWGWRLEGHHVSINFSSYLVQSRRQPHFSLGLAQQKLGPDSCRAAGACCGRGYGKRTYCFSAGQSC